MNSDVLCVMSARVIYLFAVLSEFDCKKILYQLCWIHYIQLDLNSLLFELLAVDASGCYIHDHCILDTVC